MLHVPSFSDAAGVHKEDIVRIFDGIEAMRDNDACRTHGKFFQYRFEELFGDRVDVGGRFIKDEQLGFTQHRAHECDELLLSKTDRVAGRGHFGIESVREMRNEFSHPPRHFPRAR